MATLTANTAEKKPAMLPPPPLEGQALSEDHRSMVRDYVDGLVLEAYWRGSEWNLWDRAQTNVELTMYGRSRGRPTGRYRANKIKTAVRTNVATMAARRPRANITQRATGAPPKYYLNLKAVGDQNLQATPTPEKPLDDQQVALIQTLIQTAAQEAAATGQPPKYSPDILFKVDDAALRKAAQLIVDEKFDNGGGLPMYRENTLYNTIMGYQFMSQWWDENARLPRWRDFEPVCVYVDCSKTKIKDMAYVVADEFMGKYEALSLYGKNKNVRAAIEKTASSGIPMLAGRVPYQLPRYWLQKYFYRQVIIIRKAWIRYQEYPMTLDEAADAGHVLKQPMDPGRAVLAGHVKEAPNELSEPASGMAAQSGNPGGLPGAEASNGEGNLPTGPVSNNGGENVGEYGSNGQVPPANPVQNNGYTHAATGQPVSPGHPDWPDEAVDPETGEPVDLAQFTRESIREITLIAGECYEDKECQHAEIPVHQNVLDPIPFTPFGQGLPEHLERLQEAHNNVLTDIVVNGEYATSPAHITTAEVIKQNPNMVNNAFTTPGRVYKVDKGTWQSMGGAQGKEMVQTIMPPPTPPDQWKREQVLSGIFENISMQTQVARGEVPTNNASGKMVQMLQAAHTNVMDSSAWPAEEMLERIFRQILTDTIMFCTPEQLAADFPQFPVYIWTELHRLLTEHYLSCKFEIEVGGGGQTERQSRAAFLTQAKQGGVPVSDPEIMENLDLDPDEQIERQADFDRRRMATQGPMMQPGNVAAVAPQQGQLAGAAQAPTNPSPTV